MDTIIHNITRMGMKGEEIPEDQPLPVQANGSGRTYKISEQLKGRLFEVQISESQNTKYFCGKRDFRLPETSELAISEGLSKAIVDGKIKLTNCDRIQIGKSTIELLGKRRILSSLAG
jgi:hypothetical protein